MSPSQVNHLFAHSSGSKGRSLLRSPITRAIDEVDGESSSFRGSSSTLGNTTDCEPYENDRRTLQPRSRWNLNTLLDRLRLYPNAPGDDTAVGFDDEAIGKISPLTSSVEEVAISQDDIVIALIGPGRVGNSSPRASQHKACSSAHSFNLPPSSASQKSPRQPAIRGFSSALRLAP
ncbi:hypothetical protein PISMIDRAFT_424016 [Pisolithus microcarpus 441]|uniref:Uncharacterized protein n=1 Tax=Pisolithus microcarpus 441 TaxID=765257 RepID=A0A0C9YXT1_9AGAM|nr:hypothetical protein BKA83DRAFT_424016 [Pisolithus microcarpus]KIK12758.1 hypothetical protein PISMIDRAFT_424016 [Pisolithus microcarpus 441]